MALFDVLPEDIFRPLASPSRRFLSELLLSLHEKTFGVAAEPVKRADAIQEINFFLTRWETERGVAELEEADSPREERPRRIYARLLETGWLMEHKDRYIRTVDLDPDAAGLLHALASIARGETRTYGGAVVSVLTTLENAAANPTERSENIRNAVIAARDFLGHMRMVSVSLRKVEDRILRQETLRDIFRSFFVDFVQKHLIADFKTLHTKNNPFRFRSRIMRQAREISASPLTVMALGESYYREGRSASPAMGQVAVLDDLALIIQIFESTEAHLAAIDATVARIERRIANTARYMDRVGRTSEAAIMEAMKAVAGIEGNPILPVPTAVLRRGVPIGPPHIPSPYKAREPIGESVVRKIEKDPAHERFLQAKSEYLARTRVTPSALLGFLERVLGDRTAVQGSNIDIATIDDFIAFQRLRELPTIFDGSVSRRYEIELLEGRVANDWIECQDFIVRRRRGA